MSWLDDEASTNKQREEAERHSEEVLMRSNYWGAIVQKLRDEIETINSHEYWKKKLAGFPLRLNEPLGEPGYQVSKSGYPAVVVKIQQKPDHILVSREFIENPLSINFRRTEKLRIGTVGDSAVLVTEQSETLIVPEDAVKYILKPIIESLKITKSAP